MVCGGDTTHDGCGVCGGGGVLLGECDCEHHVLGCDGECASGLVFDNCGVCGGAGKPDTACDCFGNVLDC